MNKLIIILFIFPHFLFSQNLNKNFWTTDGYVTSMITIEDKIYFGGQFNFLGEYSGHVIPFDLNSGHKLNTFPKVEGEVHSIINDGNGGWYIGGNFKSIGGVNRLNIAHVNSSGSISNFKLPVNNTVNSLCLADSILYVGGQFTKIGDSIRYGFGRINTLNNQISKQKETYSVITKIVRSGDTIFVAGQFNQFAGQTRNGLAAFNKVTGNVYNWIPDVNGGITSLAVSGDMVYVGGYFTSINSQFRNGLAAINRFNNVVSTWNPNPWGQYVSVVKDILPSGSLIYIGGYFSQIGGQPRNSIAAVDASSGIATSWNPNIGGTVNSLAILDDLIYVGGLYTQVNSQTKNNLSAININSGNVQNWNPNANNQVNAIVIDASEKTLYVGGKLFMAEMLERKNLAAIDAKTGRPLAWKPEANNTIWTMSTYKDKIYIGGDFTMVSGFLRQNFAELDSLTNLPTSWSPNTEGFVRTTLICNNTLYIGGNSLSAYNIETHTKKNWSPNCSGGVTSLANANNVIYVGGSYQSIGGANRNSLAAIDTATGLATDWNPYAMIGCQINALTVYGDKLYAGGSFYTMGNWTQNGIAAIDTSTGLTKNWNPDLYNSIDVFDITGSGNKVYIGGAFTEVADISRKYLAAIDTTTDIPLVVDNWNPSPNGGVFSILFTSEKIFIGGQFNAIGDHSWGSIASFDINTVNNIGNSGSNFKSKHASIIFPNPSKDKIFISSVKPAYYKIYNIIGSLIKENKLNSKEIDVSSLQTGTYLLEIIEEGKLSTFERIIIEH